MSGNDFWTSGTGTGNGKFHSHFRERECECEWQIPFPFSGTGMQINRKFHSRLSGTENSREFPGNFREFPGNPRKISFPFTGTGMQMENSIPIFGNGNASGKFHSRLSGRELEAGIPGNSREREFSLTPGWGTRLLFGQPSLSGVICAITSDY